MSHMDAAKREATLREALQAALVADPVDYGEVLRLSNELANLDPNIVRFSVDAGHISRLGRELVSRQETAVSELVKNAYDADATEVTLGFRNADRIGGSLEIQDNGNGMTRDDLIRGFMRLSSTVKVHAPLSPRFRRQRAGRKGIGRFAAQRLGQSLTITTQVAASAMAVQVRIDWNAFAADQDLAAVASTIREVPKEREQGTTLLIEGLREHWTDSSIKKASRNVIDLLQPFPLAAHGPTSNESADPGFVVIFKRIYGDREVIIADEQRMLLDHALAVIAGEVDQHGNAAWSVLSQRLKVSDAERIGPTREDTRRPFSALRNVQFRAYYFILESSNVSKQALDGVRAALSAHGGIRVYRNGFRVLPYGDRGDDWLGLDESYNQRLLLVPHANRNFFGFVELQDPTGEQFEETSSREGLLNNEAFAELVDYTSRAIKAGVIRINEARGVKITAAQKTWTPTQVNPAQKIRSVAQDLTDAADRITAGPAPDGASGSVSTTADDLKELALSLHEVAEQQEQQERALLEEIGMLRVLASLGLTIGEFTHEIRQYLPAVQADTEYFAQVHADDASSRHVAERLRSNFAALRTYATYFDSAVADNATRQLRAIEVRDAINGFARTVAPTLARTGITLDEPRFEGYRLYTCPMHASEWASILFNFFTNSRKAIKRKGAVGRIAIKAGRENGMIFVEFADNGDGIPAKNVDRIFNAFFTTSSPASARSADHEEVLGTGLGLKIVQDIVTAYGGTVRLADPPPEFATSFRVEVPEAAAAEVPDSDY